MSTQPTIKKHTMLEKFNTITARVVWADLERPDKYGKYGVTLTVDTRNGDWATFKKLYMQQVEEGDLPTGPEHALRDLGEWGAKMLNECDDTTGEPTWFEGDVVIKLKTNKLPRIADRTIKCGDTVIAAYGMRAYSFMNEEGEQLEGVSLYLNGVIKD